MNLRKIIAGISALSLAVSATGIVSAAEADEEAVTSTEITDEVITDQAEEEIDPEFTISEEEENSAKPVKPEKPVKPGAPVKPEKTEKPEKPEKPEPPKVNINDIDLNHPDKDKIKEYTQIDISEITNDTLFGSGYSEITKDLGFNWNAAIEWSKAYDEEGVFTGFTGLIKFEVDMSNEELTSVEGVLFDKAMKVLLAYPDAREGTTFTIPEGVEKIASFAFDNCKNLKKVKLPHTVKEIGPGAFKGSAIEDIELPEGIKKVGPGAFKGCSDLKEVKLPDSVKVIGEEAFQGCEQLESINVPEKLESVQKGAFDDCTSVDQLVKEAIEKYCELVYGDVNNDKVKNLSDLTELALILLKEKDISKISSIAADVVDDDVVDVADLATLKQSIMGEELELGPAD